MGVDIFFHVNGFFEVKTHLVDFFAYVYSRRTFPMEFSIVFKLKNNKRMPTGKCDGYTLTLKIIHPN